jgi:Domain of unknown function (DUF5615)
LLDENLDWRLERDLPGHDVKSVSRIGWAGIQNGELLRRAQAAFDVLITMDNRMTRELDIQKFAIAVFVLRARSNVLADTKPLMKETLACLATTKPRTVTVISS